MLLRRKGVATALATGVIILLLLAGTATGKSPDTIQIFGATLMDVGWGQYFGRGADGSYFTHDTNTGITEIIHLKSDIVEIISSCGVLIERDNSGKASQFTLRKNGALSQDQVSALQELIDRNNASRSARQASLSELGKARDELRKLEEIRQGMRDEIAALNAKAESMKAQIYQKLDARDIAGAKELGQQLLVVEGQIKSKKKDEEAFTYGEIRDVENKFLKIEAEYNLKYEEMTKNYFAVTEYLTRKCDPEGKPDGSAISEMPQEAPKTQTGSGVFKGTVTDKVTGKPVEESTVTLFNKEKPSEPPRHVKTTPEGTFEITDLPPGRYTAVAKGKCHEKVVTDVVIGPGTTNVDFQGEKKPLKVVIEISEEEAMAVGFSFSGAANLLYSRLLEATGLQYEDIDWGRLKSNPPIMKNGKIVFEAGVYLADKTQGASGIAPLCADTITKRTPQTKTPETLTKTPQTQTKTPETPAKTPQTQTKTPETPAKTPQTQTKTPETPAKTPQTQTKTPGTPAKTTTTSTQTPSGFVETNKPRVGKAGPPSPDDPLYHSKGTWGQSYDDQWALKRIGFTPREDANSAWNLAGSANAPVIVAVIDTGIDAVHPELIGKLWINDKEIPGNGIDDDKNGYIDDVYGWNFIDNNNNLMDLNGHGTVNAGIIGAIANNGIGIAGINPNVRIMPLKALDYDLNGGSIETARAIIYAVDHGARVINVSIGGSQYSRFEEMAINYAHEKGVLVVVAAGNEGVETTEAYPAGLRNVITVASTDTNNRRTNFSNWGKGISIAAPGVDILSLRARGTDILLLSGPKDYKPGFAFVGDDKSYYRVTGTSFSAPLVSGVASLLFSHNPKLTGEQVKRMILNSADDIEMPGWDQYTGYGLLNARKALRADPDYYTDARISRIAPVRKNGRIVIGVYGNAESSDFEEAWVEAGFGEKPEAWEKASERVEKQVKEGLIAEVPTAVFTRRGQWSLRLMVKTKNHGIREAWGRIKIN